VFHDYDVGPPVGPTIVCDASVTVCPDVVDVEMHAALETVNQEV